MDVFLFADATEEFSSLLEECADEYCDTEECICCDCNHDDSMITVDDFVEDAIEDEVITDEDIDIIISELYDDMEAEKMETLEDNPDSVSDEAEILNPFTEKITVSDYLNDF